MSDRKNGIPVQTGIRAVLAAAVLLLLGCQAIRQNTPEQIAASHTDL